MAWTARLKRLRDRAEQRFPVVTELTGRLLSTNLLDAATRLAAQAFLAAVPLLFAIAAFAPGSVRDQLRESLRAMFGLTGDTDQELQKVLGSSTDTALSNSSGAIGLAVALVSATSFSRAMARVCERAWRLPRAGTRIAAWRWMVWLLVLVLVVILQGPIRNGFGAGVWLGTVLFFVVGTGVWLWTQHLLLAGRVSWLPLLPGALLAAAATSALGLIARLYMPNALNRTLHAYGSLGLVLTMLSWLIIVCAAVTFGVTIGAVLAEEPPLNRLLVKDRSIRVGTSRAHEPGERVDP
ncbi:MULTISPECIES: YhjD/YihY/BrkB family envelope integrity protein [unclassified Streptomyces]|uniref:YhjD/YihY/BrkB family envelope integrity protein n=1 Tax=unclassified Streptomyces TaxID=2593676 RepID=UPI002DDBD16C|nr:YhjD/YihY/BrkB family envelope integrity protein [Streptomyces sp. NBC_00243]WRZ20614.1 YihY/virulence factor BrkB family protein [Streptomyces sp. NBC_00243]